MEIGFCQETPFPTAFTVVTNDQSSNHSWLQFQLSMGRVGPAQGISAHPTAFALPLKQLGNWLLLWTSGFQTLLWVDKILCTRFVPVFLEFHSCEPVQDFVHPQYGTTANSTREKSLKYQFGKSARTV